ncbi:MAG: hypothetical protein AMK70_04500 [Nitrospira bacterium SG8_35_1]|nr:MAG: hypothetical protein AMK70_04500 [Nitrospira bacterium SG8_35_1]
MFPARYAAEKHKMDYLKKHHGISSLQSYLAFTGAVEALNKATTAEAQQRGMQQIADNNFEGNLGKASAAISDSKVMDTMGYVGESLGQGNSPGDLKYTAGQVQANIESGTKQAFKIVGAEGIQEVGRFRNLDITAKAEQAKNVAGAVLHKAPSEVTGEDIQNLQRGHHGNNWITTNNSGSQSFVMSPDGNVLFSSSKQVMNAEGVNNLASEVESSDPQSAQKLKALLGNSNQNMSYEATVTRDAQGNVASFTVSQDRKATSSAVMQSSDISSVSMQDTPLQTDSNTVWNKIQSLDQGFSESLLSGSSAEQDTMARTVANSMAAQLFLSRHGIDGEELAGGMGFSIGQGGIKSDKQMRGFLGSVMKAFPGASINLRASNGYREQIDKISKDYYDEIKGHQQMVSEGVWNKEEASDRLSRNLSFMTREYEQKEGTSNETKRGKDIIPGFRDNP